MDLTKIQDPSYNPFIHVVQASCPLKAQSPNTRFGMDPITKQSGHLPLNLQVNNRWGPPLVQGVTSEAYYASFQKS